MKRSFGTLLALTIVLTISCAAPPEPVEEAPPVDLVAAEVAVKEMIDMTVTSGGELYEMTGWFSGILEKRGDTWKIVQLHASKPADRQAVAY